MKLLFISLGCDKNLVDTEEMLGILNRTGYTFTDDENEADAVIVNTCCFINDAKEESIGTILEMAKLKENAKCKALIVTGCMAQRYKEEIIKEIPEVDALVGTEAYNEIAEVLESVSKGEKPMCFEASKTSAMNEDRIVTTGGYFAYLKIAEGCDKCCTYCIIPKIRGNYKSFPMEELILKAKKLAEGGVRELILVAQETTKYGEDLYQRKMLPELLKKLCRIDGFYWIRIMYCYPEEITDELIQTIKSEDKICNYLDMPIQHASDNVLKRMGRRTNKSQLVFITNKLRSEIPDIVIRTTLISGFPGETTKEHEELLDFVDEMEFDRLGVFAYSIEEDTPAALMPDQITDGIKEERRDEIMELQQEIAFEKSEAMIGRKLLVMIEGKVADENAYIGRTYMDAPGVDGNIFINSDKELMSGDFVHVKVTGAAEYDLIGEIIN
jgi:ribosomal protein S12 methylthiotransferase